MNKLIKTLKQDNIACGYLYFYIHLVTEIACFYFLSRVTNGSKVVWLIPFIYDGLAFVPQGLIGYLNDLYPKFKSGIVGTILLVIAYLIYIIFNNVIISLIILCLGNALLHISGAENTLRNSNGKLSHSAIFVGGGSFGVITGKLLSNVIDPVFIILLILTIIPFILLADTYTNYDIKETKFDYINKKIPLNLIVFLSVFVVIIRGYVGYGIPTSWNKTTLQTVLLFSFMGLGKCLGGILSDTFGIKKIATLSTLFAIPFLCFGDNIMIVSLIGVLCFSMTMSITLGILSSVYKKRPGLAFGFTTIGLFLGTVPIFFIKINQTLNIVLIVLSSILCCFILRYLLKGSDNNDRKYI